MILLKPHFQEQEVACPYLEDRRACNEAFMAWQVTPTEIDQLLAEGWRKFGVYYFRPKCPGGCQECVPIRVPVNSFESSKSQRRLLRKNEDIKVVYRDLEYRDEIYELFRLHSEERFDQPTDPELFRYTHFMPSCPGLQAEFFLRDKLVAVGFLDVGIKSLSSVYFIFDPEHSKRGLGNFGALVEIEQAKKMGLEHYYLGYVVAGNKTMAYKTDFRPYEVYDWNSGVWTLKSDPKD